MCKILILSHGHQQCRFCFQSHCRRGSHFLHPLRNRLHYACKDRLSRWSSPSPTTTPLQSVLCSPVVSGCELARPVLEAGLQVLTKREPGRLVLYVTFHGVNSTVFLTLLQHQRMLLQYPDFKSGNLRSSLVSLSALTAFSLTENDCRVEQVLLLFPRGLLQVLKGNQSVGEKVLSGISRPGETWLFEYQEVQFMHGDRQLVSYSSFTDFLAKASQDLQSALWPQLQLTLGLLVPSLQQVGYCLLLGDLLPVELFDGLSLLSVFVLPQCFSHLLTVDTTRFIFGVYSVTLKANYQHSFTGFSSVFLLDTYFHFILVGLFSLVNLLVQVAYSSQAMHQRWSKALWKLNDFIVDYSLTFVTVAFSLQIVNFSTQSTFQIVSFVLSFPMFLLLLFYNFYRLYDYMNLVYSGINSPDFQEFLVKFEHMAVSLRYKETVSLASLLNPAFYPFFSQFKKLFFATAYVFLYQIKLGLLITLIALQFFQILRLIIVQPYIKTWRNLVRGLCETLLLAMFVLLLVNYLLGSSSTLAGTLQWICLGLVMLVVVINLGLMVCKFVYYFQEGFRDQIIDARNQYIYHEMVQEIKGKSIETIKLNEYVDKTQGVTFQDLPDIELLIQHCTIRKQGGAFQIEIMRMLEVQMMSKENYLSKNCTRIKAKKMGEVLVTDKEERLFNQVDMLAIGLEELSVKTYAVVEQRRYRPSQTVELRPRSQQISRKKSNGKVENERRVADNFLPFFPLSLQMLQQINDS